MQTYLFSSCNDNEKRFTWTFLCKVMQLSLFVSELCLSGLHGCFLLTGCISMCKSVERCEASSSWAARPDADSWKLASLTSEMLNILFVALCVVQSGQSLNWLLDLGLKEKQAERRRWWPRLLISPPSLPPAPPSRYTLFHFSSFSPTLPSPPLPGRHRWRFGSRLSTRPCANRRNSIFPIFLI